MTDRADLIRVNDNLNAELAAKNAEIKMLKTALGAAVGKLQRIGEALK